MPGLRDIGEEPPSDKRAKASEARSLVQMGELAHWREVVDARVKSVAAAGASSQEVTCPTPALAAALAASYAKDGFSTGAVTEEECSRFFLGTGVDGQELSEVRCSGAVRPERFYLSW